MTTLPDAPGIIQVVCKGNNDAAKWANVFHCRNNGSDPDVAMLNTFASDFATAYDGHLMEHVENEVFLTEIIATDLTTHTAAQGSWSGSVEGDYAGQPYPAQVAVVISWKQALRFRGGHPRTYLTGIPLAAGASNRLISPTYQADYLSDALGFLAAVNAITLGGADVELGMLSYYSKVVNPTPPHLRTDPHFEPFYDAAVHDRLDTQRRRLGKE